MEVDMRTNRTARFVVSVTLGFIVVASLAAAQSGTSIFQGTLLEPNQKTLEVSTEELRKILADRQSLVLDARPFMEYAVSHIPGALNVSAKPGVPMSLYVSDVKEIERLVGGDKTKSLVLYCNGPYCGKSKRLSEELLGAGFYPLSGGAAFRRVNICTPRDHSPAKRRSADARLVVKSSKPPWTSAPCFPATRGIVRTTLRWSSRTTG